VDDRAEQSHARRAQRRHGRGRGLHRLLPRLLAVVALGYARPQALLQAAKQQRQQAGAQRVRTQRSVGAERRELLRAGTMGPGTIGRFETLIVDQGWLTAPARRATGTSARSGSSGGRIGRIYWAWGRYLQMHGTQQQADAQSDGEE